MTSELMKRLKSLDQNPRHKALFLLLLRSEGYVTSEMLAGKLGVSARTIKNDVNHIAASLGKGEVQLLSKRSKGSRLIFADENIKNETKELFQLYRPETVDSDFKKNVLGLLRRLLVSSQPVRIETLQEELFLNTSNYPDKELTGLRGILSQYQLELCSEPKKGLYVTGCRFNILMCMMRAYRYFDTVNEPEFSAKDFSRLFLPQFASRKEIRNMICDAVLNTRIVFSDIYMERFVLFFILLSNVDIQEEDLPLHVRQMDFDYRITEEYRLVQVINQRMQETFPKFRPYGPIQLQVLSYMAIISTDLYRFRDCCPENYGALLTLAEEIRDMISAQMELIFHVSPSDNLALQKDLVKALIPISMKIKLKISDDIDLGFYSENGSQNKPALTQFVNRLSSLIEQNYAYECSAREKHIIFSVIHKYVNDISLEHKRSRIAIIAINGRLSTQQLKSCMELNFSSYITRIDTKVLYELNNMDTSIYDYFFCMDYGKNMRIPYRPIFFFGEDMSDEAYYHALQKVFINAYNYDRILPPVTHIQIDSDYKCTPFEIGKYLDPDRSYLEMEIGTEKEIKIYLNTAVPEESIRIFTFEKNGIGMDGKRHYIIIHLDIKFNQQKFKIMLNFIDSMAEKPDRLERNCEEKNGDVTKFFDPIT